MLGSQKRTSLVGKGWRAERDRCPVRRKAPGPRAFREEFDFIYICQENPLMILNEVGIVFPLYSYIFIHILKGNSGCWGPSVERIGYTEGKTR